MVSEKFIKFVPKIPVMEVSTLARFSGSHTIQTSAPNAKLS